VGRVLAQNRAPEADQVSGGDPQGGPHNDSRPQVRREAEPVPVALAQTVRMEAITAPAAATPVVVVQQELANPCFGNLARRRQRRTWRTEPSRKRIMWRCSTRTASSLCRSSAACFPCMTDVRPGGCRDRPFLCGACLMDEPCAVWLLWTCSQGVSCFMLWTSTKPWCWWAKLAVASPHVRHCSGGVLSCIPPHS